MHTNQTPTVQSVVETVTPAQRTFIPWRAAGTLALQALEQKITRRFARIVTEVVDEPVYGHNFDLPHARHSVEQGYEHPTNTHLEPVFGKSKIARGTSQMDGSHFRELCVRRGNGLHVLHLKSKLQLQPKTWLRAEYVAEKTGIPYDLAHQIVQAFKVLSVTNWPVAKRLLTGVVATGKIWTPAGTLETGIKGKVLKPGIARSKDPVAAAKILIDLAEKLETPAYTLDKPEADVTELSQMYSDSMTYGCEIVGGYDEPDRDEMADDDTPDPLEEPPVDDMLDAPGTDNAFSSHPLADGSDALPYGFEWQIRNASAAELKQLAAGMFTSRKEGGSDPEFEFHDDQRASLRQKTGLTEHQIDLAEQYIRDPKGLPPGTRLPKDIISWKAVKVPKRFWFFSVAQIKHFWAVYNVRKRELAEESRQDPNFARIKVFVATASRRDAAAAIYAYRDGRAFDLYGIDQIVDGNQTPSKETLDELWGIFKAK